MFLSKAKLPIVAGLGVAIAQALGLIAVELRNWFVRELKAQMPVFQIVQAKSLLALAEKVAGKCLLVKASRVVERRVVLNAD
jgi:hypothetical protein